MLLAGCSTQQANQELSGIATVSSLAIALPLTPLMIPYAVVDYAKYRKETNSDKAIYEKLDPVYQERIQMIKARSPKADADKAWDEKATAFLGGDYHNGLEGTEFCATGEDNRKQIAANEFLAALQALLSDDPLQRQVHHWNKKYIEFEQTAWAYEKSFNLEMYQQIKNSKLTGAKPSFRSQSP